MLESLPFITPAHIAFVPVVVGITQLFKGVIQSQNLNRFIPIIAIIISIGLCSTLGGGIFPIVIGGVSVGLAACGMYSAGSTIKNG